MKLALKTNPKQSPNIGTPRGDYPIPVWRICVWHFKCLSLWGTELILFVPKKVWTALFGVGMAHFCHYQLIWLCICNQNTKVLEKGPTKGNKLKENKSLKLKGNKSHKSQYSFPATCSECVPWIWTLAGSGGCCSAEAEPVRVDRMAQI